MMAPFRQVAVVGAGAVGCYFGAMLARGGHPVTLIGRAVHVQAIGERGLRLERAGRIETVALQASVDLAAARDADLVLFCVKSTDTEPVAAELAPHLAADAIVLSLQNGMENGSVLAHHLRLAPWLAAVYVAASMEGPGWVKHHGRGDLVVGPMDPAAAPDPALEARLQAIADGFAQAQVPLRLTNEVRVALWSKLLVNCACNAISALAQLPYGRMAEVPAVRELQRSLAAEVVAVAAADGVSLRLEDAMLAVAQLAAAMPAQLSSTAQDMARSRPGEIDHLNGFVVRRGAELGIPVPVNQSLYAMVKLVESAYADQG